MACMHEETTDKGYVWNLYLFHGIIKNGNFPQGTH